MDSFTLPDPYDGWPEAALKSRLRELVRSGIRNERIIAMMTEYAPEVLERLPAAYRHRARALNAAYRDDPPDTGSVT